MTINTVPSIETPKRRKRSPEQLSMKLLRASEVFHIEMPMVAKSIERTG
jgi:hypothetical protein